MAGAPKENTNAEKWTLEESQNLMNEAYAKSIEKIKEDYKYDFIGEIARDLGQYKELFNYLVEKFPSLNKIHNAIKSNCEANCFYNGKKNNIVPSMAIMNLKSNHGWTDRAETTMKGKIGLSQYTDEELAKKIKELGNS